MKPKAEFLSLPEELLSYILSFLPWRDILRCTSVCKALRLTYISSSELQYLVELGGQCLLPVPVTDFDNCISIYERLQLLRDKAHTWFKFDLHSFQTVSIPEQIFHRGTSLADGHLCVWEKDEDFRHSARVFPILPKPSRKAIEYHWSPGSLCSVPNACIVDVLMEPMQNLMAIAYVIDHDTLLERRFYVDLRALDGDGIHPRAAGQTLFVSVLTTQDNRSATENLKLKCFGKHIALQCSPLVYDGSGAMWWLQLWNWRHSTTSNSNLRDTILFDQSIGFCFVGNDRLLIASDHLKLYSIEDMSREPQLLASYLMPVSVMGIQCHLDDIAHSSQDRQTMWTSDPENRLLSLVTYKPRFILVISTRIFFDLSRFGETPITIPWTSWGPPNARAFQDPWDAIVCGNRVVQPFRVVDEMRVSRGYSLYMMDFSPLAVERHRGLGRVVKESIMTKIPESEEIITTSMPYVEVASDRVFPPSMDLTVVWVEKDRIYLAKLVRLPADMLRIDQFEIVEV
ncbi:uncharacterized protein EDB91DRAFT_235469 [Suillus paluster]|uniref:uncharacterized protein n=1 Tax=Suillus paluster TaxID=48578 RepID=UPI001B860059|nr:uncharacterized protein EDB91DRAFT_235469 [Suillus paluster]KAG1743221.1 hypothetical protein EDB91DRAFT_235469 [Suillus paluster]